MSPVETVLEFIERINQRDAARLAALMTEDHVFLDALGHAVRGRENMHAGWLGYHKMCPDYWVSYESVFSSGPQVAVFGEAGGTIARDGKLAPENQWPIPAAWLGVVENNLVKQWRVYADNTPVYDILAKR